MFTTVLYFLHKSLENNPEKDSPPLWNLYIPVLSQSSSNMFEFLLAQRPESAPVIGSLKQTGDLD